MSNLRRTRAASARMDLRRRWPRSSGHAPDARAAGFRVGLRPTFHVLRALTPIAVLGALVAGCGAQHAAAGRQDPAPIPTAQQVTVAMNRQPRIVQTLRSRHVEAWVRVVFDSPARYQAIYENGDNPASLPGLPRARLTLVTVSEHGFQYRWTPPSGCYRRFKGAFLNRQAIFGADLPPRGARPMTSRTGAVIYPGQEGERVTVNRRTSTATGCSCA